MHHVMIHCRIGTLAKSRMKSAENLYEIFRLSSWRIYYAGPISRHPEECLGGWWG
jgi:hypothetical protein